MAVKKSPSVLIVDDKVEEVRGLEVLLRRTTLLVESTHPHDITASQLRDADLVLVDLALDEWPGRDEASSLALKPLDGLAVANVLKSYTRKRKFQTPKAFAILSARIEEFASDLPSEQREHIFPRLHDLEWAFRKTGSQYEVPLHQQVESLASAVSSLPKSWARPRAKAEALLGLGEGEWSYQAWEDVEICHPPMHELSSHSHGLAFVRWLLHRILPYPCFLWDSHHLAARLRVSHGSFLEAWRESQGFQRLLAPFQYAGILSDFIGPRWWQAGAENFIWKATTGRPQDDQALRDALAKRAKLEFAPTEGMTPVVCSNEQLRPLEQTSDRSKALRIQPDDWPPYADQAWTTPDLARSSPLLRSQVIVQDRTLLKDNP